MLCLTRGEVGERQPCAQDWYQPVNQRALQSRGHTSIMQSFHKNVLAINFLSEIVDIPKMLTAISTASQRIFPARQLAVLKIHNVSFANW